jgi:hypothetical protein
MGTPAQLLDIGVTVKIAVTGTDELLLLVNDAIDPIPVVDASPTAGFVFVQLYTVFATPEPLKLIAAVGTPLQRN